MTRTTKINFILSLYWLRQFFVKSLSIQVTKVERPMFAQIEWAIFSLLQGEKRTCRVEGLFKSFESRSARTLYFCRALPSVRTRRSWLRQKSSNKRASARRTRAKTFYPCWLNRKGNRCKAVELAGAKVTKTKSNNKVFCWKNGKHKVWKQVSIKRCIFR